MLGPATVALGVPLAAKARELRRMLLPMLVVGLLLAYVSGYLGATVAPM